MAAAPRPLVAIRLRQRALAGQADATLPAWGEMRIAGQMIVIRDRRGWLDYGAEVACLRQKTNVRVTDAERPQAWTGA